MWQFHDGGDWIWMTVVMAFIWVPIVLAVLWALGRGFAGPNISRSENEHDRDDPEAIVRLAYARGELSRERFLEVVEDLDRTKPTTKPA